MPHLSPASFTHFGTRDGIKTGVCVREEQVEGQPDFLVLTDRGEMFRAADKAAALAQLGVRGYTEIVDNPVMAPDAPEAT